MPKQVSYSLALLCLMAGTYTSAKQMNYNFPSTLIETVFEYGRAKKLSHDQVKAEMFKCVVMQPCFSKAGCGLINQNSFIDLRNETNSLRLGVTTWNGKPARDGEVVVLSGNRVIAPKDHFDAKSIVIVVFSPKQVCFIDYANQIAGCYKRDLDATKKSPAKK
jgi:hypothetical protein